MRGELLSIRASFLLGLLLGACSGQARESLPGDLLHVWRTADPPYADRHFELRSDWIIFGTGRGGFSMQPILGVESEPGPSGSRVYIVRFREEDGANSEMRITYRPGPPPSLLLGKHDEVWVWEEQLARANPRDGES